MRRALLIGIDNYPHAPLEGCVADAERMAALLSKHGDDTPNFDCRVVAAPRGGGTLGRARLRELIEHHFTRDAQTAFLHFSGHGLVNGLGGFIVTSDGERHDEGIALEQILQLANRSLIPEIAILLDCCHGASINTSDTGVATMGGTPLREGISILAASGGSEVSLATSGGGVFTSLVCNGLEGQAADLFGRISIPGIYAYVEGQLGAWDQRPRFRANLKSLVPIRKVAPRVALDTLRRLPVLFPSVDGEHALTPSHESSTESPSPELVKVFAELQRLNRQGLVEPVGEAHMYFAALHGKSCRLTAFGRHIWALDNNHRI